MITSFSGQHRFLSNFWYAQVVLDGVYYPTVEHAYQAAKTLDPVERRDFAMPNVTAGEAKKMGRSVTMRPDWERVKLSVMEGLLQQKFSIPQLKKQLADTSPHELIEGNTWNDTFWGVCNGRGKNHLGKLLMAIRDTKGG